MTGGVRRPDLFLCDLTGCDSVVLNGREWAAHVWSLPSEISSIGFLSDLSRLQHAIREAGLETSE